MIITLTSTNGSLTLNDVATPGYLINNKIIGLGLPKRRISSGERTDRDGGYVGAHLYGMRNVSIPLLIYGTSPNEFETRKAAFTSVIENGEVTVNVTTNDARQFTFDAVIVDADFPYDPNPLKSEGNLELLAPDAILYDNSTSGLVSATLARQTGGGLTWPLTWPLTWSAGSGPTNVVNSGSTVVYPTITLSGVMTNPTITNTTTGLAFKLTPFTSTTGDVVVIQMAPTKRTVLLNGGSIAPLVPTDGSSSWFGLVEGTNRLVLTTSSGSDTVTGLVEWKPGVMGI